MGGERPGLVWPGLCRRKGVCVCVGAGQHAPAQAETWSGSSVGGRALGWVPHRGAESERDQGQQGSAGSCVCVCVRPCGSALEPPGTHRNAALSAPRPPLFHKEVAMKGKGQKSA